MLLIDGIPSGDVVGMTPSEDQSNVLQALICRGSADRHGIQSADPGSFADGFIPSSYIVSAAMLRLESPINNHCSTQMKN